MLPDRYQPICGGMATAPVTSAALTPPASVRTTWLAQPCRSMCMA